MEPGEQCPTCGNDYDPHRPCLCRSAWVACEACGGSGEIIRREPGSRDPADEYNELCAVCEGTGRDCVDDAPREEWPSVMDAAETPFAENH